MSHEDSDQPTGGRRDFVIRAAALGVLYALALGFAVAFSPSLGIAPQQPAGQDASLAATPAAR